MPVLRSIHPWGRKKKKTKLSNSLKEREEKEAYTPSRILTAKEMQTIVTPLLIKYIIIKEMLKAQLLAAKTLSQIWK